MRGIALGKSPLASSRISFGYGSGELFPARGLGLVRIYIAPKRRTIKMEVVKKEVIMQCNFSAEKVNVQFLCI